MTSSSATSSGTSHRPPLWLAVPGGISFLAVAVAYAFYVVFSRMMSLDEGYLMITVKGFLEGHPLYDTLFTQYGPFYYVYEWLLRAVLRIPLTHDATRWLCIFHWITASVLLGLAGGKMTRSTLAGVFVFAQSVVHLQGLANEPGHPQEIVTLLLALSVLAVLRQGSRMGGWEMAALVTAALTFTKINVGVFLGFAFFLAIRCHAGDRLARVTNWLLLAFCAALPFLLMRLHLAQDWCLNYSLTTACTLAATFAVATRFTARNAFPASKYVRAIVFFIVPAVCLVGVCFLTDTSARGLLEGLVLTPMKMPGVAVMSIALPRFATLNALLAMAVAILAAFRGLDPRVISFLKLGCGLVGALCLGAMPELQMAVLLPWIWLVVIPASETQAQTHLQTFPRVFLCLAAACEALQAYPVAGTQVTIATFLLVLTSALCLVDALRTIELPARIREQFAQLKPGVVQLVPALAVAALLCLFANFWCRLPEVRRAYASLAPLQLPGSHLVRLQPEAAQLFEELSGYLEAESDTFITYPCLNSLYFWSGKQPPTQMNGTGWLQFSHGQQEQILAAVRRVNRPRIVIPTYTVRNWQERGADFIAPLVRCVSEECYEVKRIGPYSIFAPKRDFHASR